MSERIFPPFRQRFLGRVCQFKFLLYFVLIFQFVLFLLTAVSYLTVELPPATLAIVYIDFILLGILLTSTSVIIYACNRYHANKKLIPRLG